MHIKRFLDILNNDAKHNVSRSHQLRIYKHSEANTDIYDDASKIYGEVGKTVEQIKQENVDPKPIYERTKPFVDKTVNWILENKVEPYIYGGLVGAALFSLSEYLSKGNKKHFARAMILGGLTGVSLVYLFHFVKMFNENLQKAKQSSSQVNSSQ